MGKVLEMVTTSPEWVQRFNDEDWAWIKARVDELVPVDDD
jgi:hypothetical protein